MEAAAVPRGSRARHLLSKMRTMTEVLAVGTLSYDYTLTRLMGENAAYRQNAFEGPCFSVIHFEHDIPQTRPCKEKVPCGLIWD